MTEKAEEPGRLEAGTYLDDKYRIERMLGEGVMGVVFEAVNVRLDRHVAIKFPQPEVLAQPELVERFMGEARAAARLRHHNSARVIDVDVTSWGMPFMVMELLEGRDLAAELAERGALPVADAVRYVIQACAAMVEAHGHGIVHRDLKPSNLFLARDADGASCIKVLDFGISTTRADPLDATGGDIQMGTPLYMSPEQVRAAAPVDLRTDIWSLGVVLYELISGEPPFGGVSAISVGAAIVADAPPSLQSCRRDLPHGLEAVVFKALSKRPEDRYGSMQDMIAALAPFAGARLLPGVPASCRVPRDLGVGVAMALVPASSVPTASASHRASVVAARRHWLFGGVGAAALIVMVASYSRDSLHEPTPAIEQSTLGQGFAVRRPEVAAPGAAPALESTPPPEITSSVAPEVPTSDDDRLVVAESTGEPAASAGTAASAGIAASAASAGIAASAGSAATEPADPNEDASRSREKSSTFFESADAARPRAPDKKRPSAALVAPSDALTAVRASTMPPPPDGAALEDWDHDSPVPP